MGPRNGFIAAAETASTVEGNTGAFVMARGRWGRRGRRPGHVCTDIIGTGEALRPAPGGCLPEGERYEGNRSALSRV